MLVMVDASNPTTPNKQESLFKKKHKEGPRRIDGDPSRRQSFINTREAILYLKIKFRKSF